ncbi:MBL fold metallo-hydrolase [Kozakia baliensis]|uniref:MBL fold metallo-hydrolase n=1 Tax=Kozakia baliensis TaxID=153496 RepID=UPI001D05287D|nr:MBL fold metallo-hydrolase [Kozakia baliensis]
MPHLDRFALPYPLSDHYNGSTFFNPPTLRPVDQPAPQPLRRTSIFRWQMGFRWRWPNDLPSHRFDFPPAPAPGKLAITLINHSTFFIQIGRQGKSPFNVITDPIFSQRCSPFRHFGPKRVQSPGHAISALPRVDAILVSHCHYDHLDLPSLRALAERDDPICITPLGNRHHVAKAGLAQIVELDWWEHFECDGMTFTCTPALHGTARTPFDANKALWGGFMLTTRHPELRIFFAGDSAHGQHWRLVRERLGAPDVALLPIGAYEPRNLMYRVHMNPEEALAAFEDLHAKRALACHYGTFQLTDEPIGEPPARLRLATRAKNMPDNQFESLRNGETRDFTCEEAVSLLAITD